jgi:hypothetical protein
MLILHLRLEKTRVIAVPFFSPQFYISSYRNQVVSKRMVKKWTKRRAHDCLQIRTRVLN